MYIFNTQIYEHNLRFTIILKKIASAKQVAVPAEVHAPLGSIDFVILYREYNVNGVVVITTRLIIFGCMFETWLPRFFVNLLFYEQYKNASRTQ